jgi:hypothetical protein
MPDNVRVVVRRRISPQASTNVPAPLQLTIGKLTGRPRRRHGHLNPSPIHVSPSGAGPVTDFAGWLGSLGAGPPLISRAGRVARPVGRAVAEVVTG